MIRRLLLVLAALFAMPAAAQTPQAPAPATVKVRLHTTAGDIVVALETAKAPITAGNFLRYVDSRRLDGAEFYRAMKTPPEGGLVQGGVRDPRKLYPPIPHEPTSKTGLSHVDGALSAPRFALGTARGDFTIMVGDHKFYDAGTAATDDRLGYAVFGNVVEGMDIVRRLLVAPTSPTEGEGVMKGQMLAPRITILTARRIP